MKVKQATPLIPAAKQAVLKPATAKAIDSLRDASDGINKAQGAERIALVAFIKSVELGNAAQFNLTEAYLKNHFGEARAVAAGHYLNLLRNARKVEAGGTKGKTVVKGRGRAAMLEVLNKGTSLAELKKGMSEAKPEGLKEAPPSADSKSVKVAKAKQAKTPVNAGLPTKREDVFMQACKLLELCETFLKAGTDAETIGKIDAALAALRTAEIAARMPKAA